MSDERKEEDPGGCSRNRGHDDELGTDPGPYRKTAGEGAYTPYKEASGLLLTRIWEYFLRGMLGRSGVRTATVTPVEAGDKPRIESRKSVQI